MLFNAAFSTGQVPHVPRRIGYSHHQEGGCHGHSQLPANLSYKPSSRLYASIVVQRRVKYIEQERLQSSTQTGCCPQLGTIHPAFALQHVIDKHRHASQPHYLCFVDLKSAYDKVQWDLLWGLLSRCSKFQHLNPSGV